jgi:hypothetical protein
MVSCCEFGRKKNLWTVDYFKAMVKYLIGEIDGKRKKKSVTIRHYTKMPENVKY